MASSESFIQYVCEQIEGVGHIRYKKMFGEYMIYIKHKPIIIVCDDTPYVKMHEAISPWMKDASTGYPYPNAKMHYILDVESQTQAKEIINILETHTPIPKKKVKTSTS